jgi:dolichol-phosphate mannosyltransferase
MNAVALDPESVHADAGFAPAVSLVVPFFNEEDCAGHVLAEIERVFAAEGLSIEVLMVDDGSRDGTPRILEHAAAEHAGWRHVRLEPNQGQAAALMLGLTLASAPIVMTMDGDGQNDPADFPAMLTRLGGADRPDMVVGIRAQRRDSWLRRAMSRLANRVRSRFLGDGVHDSGCALKVFRREVVAALIPLRTLYSFIPALAVGAGFRVVEMPVNHRPRHGGKSSYGFGVFMWRPLIDMLGVWWFVHRRFPPPPVVDRDR